MMILRRVAFLVAATFLLQALMADGCIGDACPGMCEEQGDSMMTWESVIRFGCPTPFTVNVTWNICTTDSCGEGTAYLVQYREKGSAAMYETIHANGTTIEITGLQSQTQYEVRVCLQQNSTDCGNCVRCFETLPANEPPSPPRSVMAEGTSPQSITVTFLPPIIWNSLTDITYNLTYESMEEGNLTFIQFGATVQHNMEGKEERLIEGLEEDTSYIIIVTAINSIGSSLPSEPVEASTKAFTNDTGALLISYGSGLYYYQVNDVTVIQANPVAPTQRLLHTFPAIVQGISYHLYRPSGANKSEIYVSLESGEIQRLTVAVSKDIDNVDLTVIGNDTVYSVSEYQLGRLSVDWVYNILYWVEIGQETSRIRRLELDGGVPEQVGLPMSGVIRDIFPDPIYGYFYWLVVDSHLFRVPMSVIMSADQDSPNLVSFATTEISLNNTAITSFTIDLVDLNLFYLHNKSVFLVSLSGTQLREFFLGPMNTPLPLISSYQDFAFSYLASNLVLTRMVLSFADTTTNQDISEFAPLEFEPMANIMFRESLQPLPAPPTFPGNIRVKPTIDSVNVTWNAPQFFGSIHGESAFSDWEYEVIYGLVNDNNSLASTGKNRSLSQFIPGLMPETTYWFQVRVSGPGGSLITPCLAFTTMTVTNQSLELLVAADPGVFRTNLDGEAEYIQRGFSDRSNGTVYDSFARAYFWLVDDTAGGNLFVSTPAEDAALLPSLEGRNNPFALSLDWIGRNLYWIEGDSNRLVTVPLSNITDEAVRLFAMEDFITDVAVDSLHGLVFWTSSTGVKARTINGLFTLDCINVAVPRSLAVDSNRSRLYYLTVDNNGMVTLGQVEYTIEGCCCQVEHVLPKFSLQHSLAVSMVYAAGTLFIAQYSSTVIYFVPADLAAINPDTTMLAVGEVRPTLDIFIPMQFRDLSVILDDTQPLPAGLSPMMLGDVAPETPLPQPMDNGSTSIVISIIWEPIPLEFSPVFYMLQYILNQPTGMNDSGEITTMDNTLTLPEQVFYTQVNLRLRAYSLWQEANDTSTGSFILPPEVPAKVQNVRVYVYFPHRNSSIVSAQVVWDGLSILDAGGVINNFLVTVRDSNGTLITAGNVTSQEDAWEGPPFEVDGDRTEFSLAIFGANNFLYYPLIINQEYSVDVFAMNDAGRGETSDVVTFNTNGASPPLEVLLIGTGGGAVVGDTTSPDSSPLRMPAGIDSVNRFVYYVDEGNLLSRVSLDSNAEPQSIYNLPAGLSPLALTYDWLGEAVYIAGRSAKGLYAIWKVSANLSPAFPPSEFYRGNLSISETWMTSLVVDPFAGFLHWTLTDSESNDLFQLNLRNNTSLVSLLQSSGRRRNAPSGLVPTSALTQDPETGRIWLSDQSSGNILSFVSSPALADCQVEVDASSLGSGPTGLPADSIALDEQRIYWSNEDNPSLVFFVLRNDTSSLGTLNSPMDALALFTLSPGQQPLPPAVENEAKQVRETCLTPVYSAQDSNSGVVINVGTITNNSIFISWDEPTIPSMCEEIVFSYPPLMYMVDVRIQQVDIPGFPITINEPMFMITGLQPFTLYDLQVAGINQYTSMMEDIFGPEIERYTEEGVPSQVDLRTVAYSPRHVYLFWDKLNQTALRGNVTMQEFIVHILGNTTTQRTTSREVPELDRNTNFTFKVQVSNGPLRSEPAVAVVSTFLRPPAPEVLFRSNTSLACQVFFDEDHIQVTQVMVNISYEQDLEFMSQTFDGNRSYNFTFTGLLPFRNYSLVTVVEYEQVTAANGAVLGPEMDYSKPNYVVTREGVPDAPVATLDGSILSWNVPRDNGQPISHYLIVIGMGGVKIRNETSLAGREELNLNEVVSDNGEYNLTVMAVNTIGQGPASNSEVYVLNNDPFGILGLAGVIAVSVGGFIVLSVLCLSFVICCCCLSSYRSKSVSLGGDYELNRLRALAAHSHSSANPHYMWSRDDYKCTDEDMEQLTKVPRSKLHLETFIDRGEFGEVYQGAVYDILGAGTGPTPVAVKTLRKGYTTEEHAKFLSEAYLLSQFNHQNIVKVLGVCIDNDPIYIIMELMPAGDLLKFLREAKRDHGPALLTLSELIQVALDVAQGCRYLEQQHFIHRDIAARNCLVSSKGADRVVKIGDFGLAKDLYSSDYYQVEGQRKLPVRWMAPEALLQGKFVIESDIWSYGVLLWEIMTLGNQPYPGRTNQEVLQFVTGGGRLDRPENCPGRIYKLMTYCWKKYGSERIHFAQIVDVLAHVLENVHNSNRDSYYSDDDSDIEPALERQPSRSSRTPSLRSGLMSIARQGSRLRNSFRRRSLHRKDFENPSQNSEEQFIGEGNQYYRERGPF